MALGSADLAAATETLVYTCPVSKRAAVSVMFCCRAGSSTVRLAVSTSGAPTLADYIEYDNATLSAGSAGTLERSGIAMNAGDRIYARASAANVSCVVLGFEDNA
jgi:siroheme synthase (precorrin-2 oxidase/ferrochelatase)